MAGVGSHTPTEGVTTTISIHIVRHGCGALFSPIYVSIIVKMYVRDTCEFQGTTFGSLFFLSKMWVLGIEYRSCQACWQAHCEPSYWPFVAFK